MSIYSPRPLSSARFEYSEKESKNVVYSMEKLYGGKKNGAVIDSLSSCTGGVYFENRSSNAHPSSC